MTFNNYRITFGGAEIDYKSNFDDCLQYIAVIKEIYAILDKYGIVYKWHFFEPYVEITWINDNSVHLTSQIRTEIHTILFLRGILDYKYSIPSDGSFCDWYCNSDEEREFGYKTYSKSAEMALLFYDYALAIDNGRGLENQYVRRCHVLANQLALNYKQEGIFLMKRGLLCLLFWTFGHKKAVWIYQKIFRFKY